MNRNSFDFGTRPPMRESNTRRKHRTFTKDDLKNIFQDMDATQHAKYKEFFARKKGGKEEKYQSKAKKNDSENYVPPFQEFLNQRRKARKENVKPERPTPPPRKVNRPVYRDDEGIRVGSLPTPEVKKEVPRNKSNRVSFARLVKEGQQNYYELLGLDVGAESKDIKKAYRKLVLVTHPDKNPDAETAKEDFQALTKIYQTLNTRSSRIAYNCRSGLRRRAFGNRFR